MIFQDCCFLCRITIYECYANKYDDAKFSQQYFFFINLTDKTYYVCTEVTCIALITYLYKHFVTFCSYEILP